MILLVALVVLIYLYTLVSARLERTVLTAPLLFTIAGVFVYPVVPEAWDREIGRTALLHIAELGLVLLLFTDASRTELRVLRHFRALAVRLLSIGMLLTIALGTGLALVVFPGLPVWEAAILAAILAPTDAGLGQIIVQSPKVPLKIRQALNVEAGLNDGLSVPFLLFFMALAGLATEGAHTSLTRHVLEQLGLGTLIGLAVGLGGGVLLGGAERRAWVAHSSRRLGVVALPVLALLVSMDAGASMFIAAFVAGLAVQIGFKEAATHSVEFTEEWGQLVNLSVFFLFGILFARAWPKFEWVHAVYAAASLTVIRMVPVALSLAGTGLSRATVLFMGWFGPRGLASIVLGLVYLAEHTDPEGDSTVRLAVMATVFASIVAHGLSALPGMTIYARHVERLPADAPEQTPRD